MATLSELITKVKYNIGGRTDKDTEITDAINRAIEDIVDSAEWHELRTKSNQTMTSGLYYIAWSGTVRKIKVIRLKDTDGNYHPVELLGISLFREIYPEVIPTNTGIPTNCYLQGTYMYFDRMANQNLEVYIDYYSTHPVLSSPTDSCTISGIDSIIVSQATGYLFASLKQTDMAAFWFAVADAKLKDKLDRTYYSVIGQLEPY